MDNSDINWKDIINSESKKNDPIDSVIDAFNSVISTNSDALLGTGWQRSVKKDDVQKTKGAEVSSNSAWGEHLTTTNNQDENENSWNSWGNESSWGNGSSSWGNGSSWNNNNSSSSGWGNNDNQNYPTNNIDSVYVDDRRNYQDVKKVVTDIGTNSYTDNNERYHESTDAIGVNNVDMHTNNININNTRHEYDGWSQSQQQQQQQQQHSYYESQESPSPSESDASTDQNSEALDPDDVKMRLSAWHNLADPNVKERDDGIGGGQLHRRGRNFIPVDEATVLAIQQKGSNKRGGKRGFGPIQRTRPPVNKPPLKLPPKPVAPSIKQTNNSLKPPAVQKAPNANIPSKNIQQTPPNRTQQQQTHEQALKKPSPPPSQSSQRQPSRDSSLSSQPQRSQQPQQPQQPQQSQRSQPQQPQQSWTPQQLVTEPFWENSPPASPPPIQHPSPKHYANEAISNQSQPIRHQSPARSPRPAKPVQDHALPLIPPEFDSTPYRNQPPPSPVRDKPNRYNEPVTNGWEDNRNNNIEGQRNEYYEESDIERRENKSGHRNLPLFSQLRNKEPGKEQASRVSRYDPGQLLLTINVELSEGKTQAIEVHVNDDPEDLAKEFCDLWKVTNPVVMPALECLIKEEKEKRLGIN